MIDDAVEDDAADVLRIQVDVLSGDLGAVGDGEKVELVLAQSLSISLPTAPG